MNKMDKAFEQFQATKKQNQNDNLAPLKQLLIWSVIVSLAILLGRGIFYLALLEKVLTQQRLDIAFLLGLTACVLMLWIGKKIIFGKEVKKGEKNEY